MLNKIGDILKKIFICYNIVFLSLATLFILFMMLMTWGTEISIYICPFGVLWISFFIFTKISSDNLAKRIDIVDGNIVFTTYKNNQLVYKMSDIEIVKTFYRRGGCTYIFIFESGEKVETSNVFEFYIEGYDNTHLFKEFFKVE